MKTPNVATSFQLNFWAVIIYFPIRYPSAPKIFNFKIGCLFRPDPVPKFFRQKSHLTLLWNLPNYITQIRRSSRFALISRWIFLIRQSSRCYFINFTRKQNNSPTNKPKYGSNNQSISPLINLRKPLFHFFHSHSNL